MDAREKLAELIKDGIRKGLRARGDDRIDYSFEDVADHLISHGVTVQEWISVTERLPEIGQKCLIANREIVVRGWLRPDGVWKTGVSSDEIWSKFSLYQPTHWMPLPQPPKGE